MLEGLKKAIKQESMGNVLMEAVSHKKASDESIKSTFLDNWQTAVLGAENDPEVRSLIDTVPEYNEHDEDTEIELHMKSVTENLVETEL